MFPTFVGVLKHLVKNPVILLLLGLTDCNPRPDFNSEPAQYKTVAVISLLPQTITMGHIGFTVFQNGFAVFPTEFDPNALAIQTADAALSQHYQIIDLNIDQKAFFTAVENHFTAFDAVPGPHTDGLVTDQLKAWVKPGQADLIVVIDGTEPTKYVNFQSTMGWETGLVSVSGLQYSGSGDHVGVSATLEVFDGTTWQILGYGFGGASDDVISDLNWRGQPYDSLTPAQKQKLTDIEEQVVRGFIADALQNAHLTTN